MDPMLAANLGLTSKEWNTLPEGLQLALIEDLDGNNGLNIRPQYALGASEPIVRFLVDDQVVAECTADQFLAVQTKTLKKIFNLSIDLARIRLFHWPKGRMKKAA